MSLPITAARLLQSTQSGKTAPAQAGGQAGLSPNNMAQMWLALLNMNGGWNSMAGGTASPAQMTQYANSALAMGMDPQMAMIGQWMQGGSALEQTAAGQLFGAGNLTQGVGAF